MGHALTTARRNVDYVRSLEREVRRLRRENEQLTSEAMAAKTAAAHLRDELKDARATYEANHG
jgi:predicted RNase H-like nuclease (RuvC/YqgF family)